MTSCASHPPELDSGLAARLLDILTLPVLALRGGGEEPERVAHLNAAAENLLGRSAPLLVGRPLACVIGADAPLMDFITQARRQGGVVSGRNIRLTGPQIGPIDLDVTASPEGDTDLLVLALSAAWNPSDDKASEVGAFAQIARMLGHEVKNPLAGIVGAAQLLGRQAREDQQPLLSLIREEGLRIQRIVDRFAAFETFFAPRPKPTNIHTVLDSVVALARASFGAGARIDLAYDPSLPEIDVDPDHLHEAFLNLVKNAIEAALSVQRPPRILITTRYRAGFRFAGRDRPRGRGALEIAVADNGPGIPDGIAARIFEPFFTTKAGGAGVGLAVVAEIMAAHGGFVLPDNDPAGATLRLLFPLNRKREAQKQ